MIVVGFDQIRKEKPKNKDCWLGGTCKIDQQKCKNLLQLGLCKSHICANGFTIRFSTVIKPIKRFTIMEPIGLAIRPNHSGVRVITVRSSRLQMLVMTSLLVCYKTLASLPDQIEYKSFVPFFLFFFPIPFFFSFFWAKCNVTLFTG